MKPLLIYSAQDSSRYRYVLDWLFIEQLGINYQLTSDIQIADVVYGTVIPDAICIPDVGLLWETNIHEHTIERGEWNGVPTIYNKPDTGYTIPFDLFSAIFFLVSRYEEYYSYQPDKHNRYPATASILYQNGWLERPILDEWVSVFRHLLALKNFTVSNKNFSFQPTYDIDIAYSYLYKGPLRTLGASIKDISKCKFSTVKSRFEVLTGQTKDPYDSFDWLSSLHKTSALSPIYFILSSANTTVFDKNIPLSKPSMQELVKHLAAEGNVGIHPSYYSDIKKDLLLEEKKLLENIIQQRITISRQHYIKIQLPDTCRQLISSGITDDYSMGYGTHLGFRAGTGQSFLWYDLKQETTTSLRMHPFCFMDTTAMFENDLSAMDAFERLNRMAKQLIKTKSQLITVFHNFSLGTAKEWQGWNEAYASFTQQITS